MEKGRYKSKMDARLTEANATEMRSHRPGEGAGRGDAAFGILLSQIAIWQ